MLGGEGEDSLSLMGPPTARSQSGAEEGVRGRSLSRTSFLHRLDSSSSYDRASTHHSSLGWELAHLLHVCLGHYLEPGGASPGVGAFV